MIAISGHGEYWLKYFHIKNSDLLPPPFTAPTIFLAVSESIPAAAKRAAISSSEASGEMSPKMSPEQSRVLE